MYKTKLEQFEGPLDLLLQLIEKKELDISRISLLQLTDQFINYLKQSPAISMDELADFLVVAAKLLLIKSQGLFPGLTDEEGGLSLETQLKIYKEYWDAAKEIEKLIKQKHFVFFKEKMAVEQAFRPPEDLKARDLEVSFANVIRGLEAFVRQPQEVTLKKISLDERIQYLKDLVFNKLSVSFGSLVKSKDKLEKIVHFLALLELIKQQIVMIEQQDLFSDILVKKV